MNPPPLPAPPVIPSAPPPPLAIPVPVRKARRRYSPLRRALRWAVWLTLLVVVAYRVFVFKPEPRPRFAQAGGFGGNGGWNQRGGRPPVPNRAAGVVLPTNLWRIELQLSESAVDTLRGQGFGARGRGRFPGGERPEVKATVREGGVTYSNVAVHLKGAAGSFRPFDDQPAFTLNFNKHVKGQKFHGLTKISLNNSVQDPTFLNEKISRELFLKAGVPVPRVHHGTVLVNGRDLGLYVVAEGWSRGFLKEHFENTDGNLYDGGFVQDVDGNLSVVTGESQDEHPGLERLIEAIKTTGRSNRWARLQASIDVDRFASLLAMDALVCNWDGYGMNRNNYRIFHDLKQDRMVFMPHGLDQLFGTGRRMGVDSTIEPMQQGRVARVFLATPEGRQRYQRRLAELRTNVLDPDKVAARIREVAAEIRPTLAAYGPGWASDHDRRVEDLVARVRRRAASVSEQLLQPRDALKFGPDGVVRLTAWRGNSNPENGGVRYSRREGEEAALLCTFDGSGMPGSWRTRVRVPAGNYAFEGRARLAKGNEGMVALRMSGMRPEAKLLHGLEWVSLRFEFECEESVTELELVADSVADAGGVVEFDLGSLKLVRAPGGAGEAGKEGP